MLRRNFSKALVILPYFILLFLLLFLSKVYISLAFHLEIFQSELFRISIIYLYENLIFPWSTWSKWFGNQRNTLKYFWFTSLSKVEKQNTEKKLNSCIFIKVSKQRKQKNLKKRGCRDIYRTLPNIYDAAFLRKYKQLKASSWMFDMVLNTPLRLHRILKSIQNKWIPKCWKNLHSFNGDLAKDIPVYGHPKLSEAAVCICIIT